MTDLTAIKTPFGLLDRETQEALKAHGGPIECYTGSAGWEVITEPSWVSNSAYRVKPAPPKPREWWISEADECCWSTEAEAKRYGAGVAIHVREVLPE